MFTIIWFLFFLISDSVHPVFQDPVQHISRRSRGGVSVPSCGSRHQPPPEDGGGGTEAAGTKKPPWVNKARQHHWFSCCCRCGGGGGGWVFTQRSSHHPRELHHHRLPRQSGRRTRPHGDGVVVLVRAGSGFSPQRAELSQLLRAARRCSR